MLSLSWLEDCCEHPLCSIWFCTKQWKAVFSTCNICSTLCWARHSQASYAGVSCHDYLFTRKSLTYLPRIICSMQMVLQQRMAAAQSLGLDANQIRPLCSPARHTRWTVQLRCIAHLQNHLQVLVYKTDDVFSLLNLLPGHWSTTNGWNWGGWPCSRTTVRWDYRSQIK